MHDQSRRAAPMLFFRLGDLMNPKTLHLSRRSRAIFVALLAAALLSLLPLLTQPAIGQSDQPGCDLSPRLRKALLSVDNYDMRDFECDQLILEDESNQDTIWDFSSRGWRSFSISDADYVRLLELSELDVNSLPEELEGFGTRRNVRLIDLTGNPLSIDDVDFSNIPVGTGIAITQSTSGIGFQSADYSMSENGVGYVGVAFPNVLDTGERSIRIDTELDGDRDQTALITIGDDMLLHSDSRSVVYYWPLYAGSDNDNGGDWDFNVQFRSAETYEEVNGRNRDRSLVLEDLVDRDETEMTVSDADEPETSVCQRSRLVEDAIETELADVGVDHTRCSQYTKSDLSQITELTISDDLDDGETITIDVDDLSDLTGLESLKLIGVEDLPSGIFNGVGASTGLVIDFDENDPSDDDDPVAGDYTLATIPQHILNDQESHQTLVLAGELDSSGDPIVTGLDRRSYAVNADDWFVVEIPVSYTGETSELTHFVLARLPYEFNSLSVSVVDDNSPIVVVKGTDLVRLSVAFDRDHEDFDGNGQLMLLVYSGNTEDFDSLVDYALVSD